MVLFAVSSSSLIFRQYWLLDTGILQETLDFLGTSAGLRCRTNTGVNAADFSL